ncbi:response regulator transcription factor [Hansschlegelia sp. KR7-227]|uniref:response regulator transcription factor n=1 Tax=Hansschlegelia sp. KR7-227 TaxID=3400914 RepID=UPI003C0B4E8A
MALLISVVDDDDASRDAVSGLLRSMGHDVVAFASAADFLASDGLGRTALLIADHRMPGMNGLELHRHLVASGVAVPTAMMTAYPTDASRQQALNAGVMFFLAKPVSRDDLASCVSACRDGPSAS